MIPFVFLEEKELKYAKLPELERTHTFRVDFIDLATGRQPLW